MKKQELIEKLKAAGTVSSNVFIPVSDVIKMVEDLEAESSEISETTISNIAGEILLQLDRRGRDVISDFEIDTDIRRTTVEISISEVSFDSYEIESIVENAVEKFASIKEESSEVYN